MARADRTFYTLDALRGIAAVGVVIFHFSPHFAPLRAPCGYLAVDLFFIMSGAVIAHAYDQRFRAGMTGGQFMRVRLIRLGPLYLLGNVAGLVLVVASLHGLNIDLHGLNIAGWSSERLTLVALLSLVMLPNLAGVLYPFDLACWSLFFEVVVNAVFGFVALWITRRRLAVVAAVSGAVVAGSVLHFGTVDLGYTVRTFLPGLARAVFGFSVGVLIARSAVRQSRPASAPRVLALCVLLGAVISRHPAAGAHREIMDLGAVLVLFPAMVVVGVRVDPPAWLRSAARFLGLTSYAVYVLHQPFFILANSAARHLGEMPRGAGWALLAVLLAICWAVDRYYDLPVRRALTRRGAEELRGGRPAIAG